MKKYIAFFVLLFICSCGNQSETPIEVAHRMKSLACMGDIEGFYSYIDNDSVEKNYENVSTDLIKQDLGSDPSSIIEFQEIVIPSLIVLKWEVISRELANGEDGAFCNMQLLNNPDDEYTVGIIFPDGKTSAWTFEKHSGQLVVVSIIDQIPFDFAELDLGMRSKNNKPLQAKNIVSQNSEKEKIETESQDSPVNEQNEDTESKPVPKIVKEDNKIVVTKNELTQEIDEKPKEKRQTEQKSTAQISRTGYDFGSARWGMTKGQVVASEGANPISESNNMLVYSGKYNGENAKLDYVFSAGKLVRGRYVLRGSSGDEQDYINNYEHMKKLLTNRYGIPQSDQQAWTNSLYKDSPDRYGFAVYIGHLSYRTKWVSARSNIVLELKSNNYNMLLEALYDSR